MILNATGNLGIGTTNPFFPLTVVGNTYISGNIGVGTTNPRATLELFSIDQNQADIILSGQEFITANNSSSNGIAFLCGVNSNTNRQLWIADSALLTKTTTNNAIRIMPNTNTIDAISTDGTLSKQLILGNSASGVLLAGNTDITGGLTITGSDAFYKGSVTTIDTSNLSNTYFNFKEAGTFNDWCYLRQIGGNNSYKLAFDFHDDMDARFCIRSIQSTVSPDLTTEVFTVDNTNVGIGITNPSQKLTINSGALLITGTSTNPGTTSTASFWNQTGIGPTISGNAISFQTNGTTETMRINNNGNVGIGTTNPRSALDVYQTSASVIIRGTYESQSSTLYLGTPFNHDSALKCAIIAEGINTFSRSKLHFCLDNTENNSNIYNASILNSKMTITNNGNIGIGTTIPNSLLHLHSNVTSANVILQFSDSTTGSGNSNGCAIIKNGSTQDMYIQNYQNANLHFTTMGSNIINYTLGNEQMRIQYDGNVGIGTTNPGLYGNYTIYTTDTQQNKKFLFNYVINDDNSGSWGTNYTATSGTYIGTTNSINSYYGDWIIIKLPSTLILSRIRIYPFLTTFSRNPSLWKCFGSNDGSVFTEITFASNDTIGLSSGDYSNGYYEKIIPELFTISYLYIAFVFNKLVGGDANSTSLAMVEFQVFCRDTSPSLLMITSLFNKNFLYYSTTGNDPNYLKLSTGGVVNNNLSVLGKIAIGTDNNQTSNLFIAGNANTAILGNVGIGTTETLTHKLNVAGNVNIDGGLAIFGSPAFFQSQDVENSNKINTFINFKEGGASNDWCYLRQIGGNDAYKLTFDFHDGNNDARFCIRLVLELLILNLQIYL